MDARAAESARAMNALAYTVGQNVIFGPGQHSPRTSHGRRLLAHELTHTLQQSRAGLSNLGGAIRVSEPGDADEREAEAIAEKVTSPSCHGACADNIHTATSAIQRLGDVTKVPPELEMQCEIANDSLLSPAENLLFGNRISTLSSLQRAQISNFVINWRTAGANAPVRVDGYASTPGTDELNWQLSCDRAQAVAAELMIPSSRIAGIPAGFVRTVAQGETSEFGAEVNNRRATISSPITSPEPAVRRLSFRAAAWSFLSCAECNPFTDDGTLGVTPPTTEPALGSTHRQMHHIEATLGTSDGRTIAPGSARLASSGNHAGMSHFCGSGGSGHLISSAPPGSPAVVTSSAGVEGIEFESEMSSRVGATVPPTLPGSPCGFLGINPLIPVIGNRFRMRIFADGTKESEFLSATLYPSHFLYEDGNLKMFGGLPVHPAQDFFAWASATVPLAVGVVGFKALRFACCHPTASAFACDTVCAGGFSAPGPFFDAARCAALGSALAFSSCPTPCAPAGASCPPLVSGSNP